MKKPALVFAALMMLSPLTARASAPQDLTYEVYAGGVNAVTASLQIANPDKAHYHVTLSAETQGLLGKLAPWHGIFESQGVLKGGKPQLRTYHSATFWHGKEEDKDMTYAGSGIFQTLTFTEGGGQPKVRTTDPALVNGTTDSLTATLAILKKVASGGTCEGTSDVFDGLRRFKLVFHNLGTEVLNPSALNIYAGPAERCTVEVIPDGGKWHEKPRGWLSIQEQGRHKGTLPTVWLAVVEKNRPALPVKIQVVTDYGTLFMHLSHYQGNGAPMTAGGKP